VALRDETTRVVEVVGRTVRPMRVHSTIDSSGCPPGEDSPISQAVPQHSSSTSSKGIVMRRLTTFAAGTYSHLPSGASRLFERHEGGENHPH